MTSPLRSRQLRRIILAYAVNRLGTWFGVLALAVAVFNHTHSALAVAALMFAGQALPAFAVTAVVARVEASRRRGDLSGLYFFEAATTVVLAVVLLWHFVLALVLLLVALDGVAALAASALLRAEVARAAREQMAGANDELMDEAERKANAALNVAFSTTFVLGPVLAGAVVAASGPPTALFVDVASFLLGGVLLLDLHPDVGEARGESVRVLIREARQHISEAPILRRLLLCEAVALIFIETGGPIEIPFVKATLHAGDRGLGLLLTAWGAGAILGSLVFARLVKRSLNALLIAGTLAIAGAYLVLAIAPSLAVACLAGLLGGVGNGLQWPSLISSVQRLVPKQLQGRLMGAVESLGALCLASGLILGGVLVAV
ncbi:MAG TPA: MFS transporter, partial [Solirubrobacteraceae bacterium]|nr:MFS transporter [Solirubrobacteraceae bacterium]